MQVIYLYVCELVYFVLIFRKGGEHSAKERA